MRKAVRRLKRSNAATGGMAGSADVRALISAFASHDGMVRHGAQQSVVAIGKPAVRCLMEALRDPREHVRWEAAKALRQVRDKTSAAAMITALEDKSFAVRWLAAEGLVALGEHALPPLLCDLVKRADSIWLREGALHILHQMSMQDRRDETRPVVAALEGPEPTLEVPPAAREAIEKLRGARRLRSAPKVAAK